jgi:diguanylate cyclase (GGDEF)-like protein
MPHAMTVAQSYDACDIESDDHRLVPLLEDLLHWLDRAEGAHLHAGEAPRRAVRSALHAARSAQRQISDLHDRLAQMERLAVTDELTGLLNRRGFEADVRRTLALAERYDEPGVLIVIDIDGFKAINDTWGHGAGDAVLQAVAGRLLASVRRTDSVGRLGGDEFALLLPRSDWVNGNRRAQTIGQMLNDLRVGYAGVSIPVAASLGVQGYDASDVGNEAGLFARADRAMYTRKQQRRRVSAQLASVRCDRRDLVTQLVAHA